MPVGSGLRADNECAGLKLAGRDTHFSLEDLHLRLFCSAFGLLLLLGSAVPGRATTITYNLVATTSAGTLTGTVGIDSATDLVTAANLTFNDAAVGTPAFSTIGSAAAYNGLGQDYISGPSSGSLNYGGQVGLFFDTAASGSGALSVCTGGVMCGTQGTELSFVQVYTTRGNVVYDITSGSLTQVGTAGASALTPEPSSLLLLGTGILTCAFLTLSVPAKEMPELRIDEDVS